MKLSMKLSSKRCVPVHDAGLCRRSVRRSVKAPLLLDCTYKKTWVQAQLHRTAHQCCADGPALMPGIVPVMCRLPPRLWAPSAESNAAAAAELGVTTALPAHELWRKCPPPPPPWRSSPSADC